MPKTKGQGLVFGILMSVTMAYGMEVYNVALKSGVLLGVKLCSRRGIGGWQVAAALRSYRPRKVYTDQCKQQKNRSGPDGLGRFLI